MISICMNIGFIFFGTYYYAKERSENRQRGFSEKGMHLSFYRELKLSQGQEAEINKLFEDYLKTQTEMKKENKRLRNELIGILAGENKPDEEKLNLILEQIAGVKKKREQATVNHLMRVKGILTEKQARMMLLALTEQTRREKE